MRRLQIWLLEHCSWLIAGLIVAIVVANVPAFQRVAYWEALTRQYFMTAALALALTPIILTGGIDLSVGSVAVFSAVVIGALWREGDWPIGLALMGGVFAGLLAGLSNSVLVTLGVLPLVATLATRELFRGLARTISGKEAVSAFPESLARVWEGQLLGIPLPLLALVALLVLTYLVVHHTKLGRMLYAMGDNEEAARFAAVPVRSLKWGLYGWSGLVGGICGIALVMQDNARADAKKSLELAAIACVVVGGVRITGGVGHVVGTLLGIVTVSVLLAGMYSIDPDHRDTTTGCVLVLVALANETATRLAARLRAVRAGQLARPGTAAGDGPSG